MSNLGADRQKKMIAIGAFVLVAAGILFYELSDSGAGPVVAPAVVVTTPVPASSAGVGAARPVVVSVPAGNVARGAGSGSQLDPTLRMGPMLVTEALVYSGSGRNIFSPTSVPMLLIPKAIAPARPKGPVVPVYVGPVGPPPPPPIELKFFGTATAGNGVRQAFLLHGEDVFLASAGDVVQRRYRVISIAASSIVVEDLTNNNQQTLPLLTN